MQTDLIDADAFDLETEELRQLSDFRSGVERFNDELDKIAAESYKTAHQKELLEQTSQFITTMLSHCKDVDRVFRLRPEVLKKIQQEFRSKTNRNFQQSFFMNRARTWPQGYPGDYKTLEYTYGNAPMSDGIGLILDKYFLSTTLAIAVRERLRTLCDMMKREIVARPGAKVLNVACGSCREIFDIAPEFITAGASATCIDFDKDALQFSRDRLSCSGISMAKISFKQYNAVKMVNQARNVKEFGPQDIIYSTGFYDYIPDAVLVPLLEASYELLTPGGVLIASFKDSSRYKTPEYHWLVKWDSFLQRTEQDTDALFSRSLSSRAEIAKEREQSGVILFYRVTKPR